MTDTSKTTGTFLHVGAGTASDKRLPRLFDGWTEVRVDIDPRMRPDIVASMTEITDVEDASMDAIWCSHSLEHVSPHEVTQALSEWRRVLKSDGFAFITTPDLMQAARLVAAGKISEVVYTSPAGPVTALDLIYGQSDAIAKGLTYMKHETGFTLDSLGERLTKEGFERVDVWVEGLSLWAMAYSTEKSFELYGWDPNEVPNHEPLPEA